MKQLDTFSKTFLFPSFFSNVFFQLFIMVSIPFLFFCYMVKLNVSCCLPFGFYCIKSVNSTLPKVDVVNLKTGVNLSHVRTSLHNKGSVFIGATRFRSMILWKVKQSLPSPTPAKLTHDLRFSIYSNIKFEHSSEFFRMVKFF